MCRALLALAAALLVALPAAAPPDADAKPVEPGALLVEAARQEKLAKKDARMAKRERRLARLVAKKAKQASLRSDRKPLKRRAGRHLARAKAYSRRAKKRRKKAARLRQRAFASKPVAHAAAAPPPRRPPIPLGTALDWQEVQSDPALRGIFLRGFNQMTAENEMKMFALQPRPGRFAFGRADEMVDWALANGKRVRGHTLVYGDQLPGWLTAGAWTRDELLAVMKLHIQTVMEHFRGRVAEWDVVNEAVVDYGNGWRPNLWYQVIGPDYVDHAFRYAREADPTAKLFYNDNGIEIADHPHTVAVRGLVAGLRRRGVPVDGVGLQNHVSNHWKASAPQVLESMRRFAALGLDVAVTEMDVATDTGSAPHDVELQREIYASYAWACRTEPRCTSFSTWGISDRYSWIQTPGMSPLPFDANLNPKPAWYAIEDWVRKP